MLGSLDLRCNLLTIGASCLCRHSNVSLSAKVPLPTVFSTPSSAEEVHVEGSRAVASSGSAPAYAAVFNNLTLAPTLAVHKGRKAKLVR